MWSWYRAIYQENYIEEYPVLLASTQTTVPCSTNSREPVFQFHQVFLTVSQVLAQHVRQYFEGLQNAHGMAVTALGRNVENLRDISESSWPLITTYSQFLRMIDGTLENQFFENTEELSPLVSGGVDYVMKKEEVASVLSKCRYFFFDLDLLIRCEEEVKAMFLRAFQL